MTQKITTPSHGEGAEPERPVFVRAGQATASPEAAAHSAVLSGGSLVAEEFRLLRAKVRAIAEDRPFQCIGISSAMVGEGKTTVAMGLAATVAQEPGRRVLLLEADLRRPALEGYLGIPRSAGLAEYLEGHDGKVTVRPVTPGGFTLLSAGLSWRGRPELLGSRRMAALLRAAREEFPCIIVDCPPMMPVADAVIMQDLLDGFLVVVRARHTARETILRGVARLKPQRIQGVIFNDQKDFLPAYDYRYSPYGDNP